QLHQAAEADRQREQGRQREPVPGGEPGGPGPARLRFGHEDPSVDPRRGPRPEPGPCAAPGGLVNSRKSAPVSTETGRPPGPAGLGAACGSGVHWAAPGNPARATPPTRRRPMARSTRSGPRYDVHPSLAYVQAGLANLEKRTGRRLEEWLRLVRAEGPPDD